MQEHDGVLDVLPSLLVESAKRAVPENATVLPAVKARLAARLRTKPHARWLVLLLPAAVVFALFGGVLAASGIAGNAPIQFVLHLMPNRAPYIAPPGASGPIPCNASADQDTTIAAAREGLRFPVFSLSGSPGAKLVLSKYVYGCDGAKSLDLVYDLNGATIEVTQGAAESSTGPLYLNLKAGDKSQTPTQLGWTIEQIDGHDVAIHTSMAGKGYAGGIDTAIWQTQGTRILVTSHPQSAGDANAGLTRQRVYEIVLNMKPV
jgi:hypothetical protein